MKLVKESLFEFYKPTSVKTAAEIGLMNIIKKEMKADDEYYENNLDDALNWAARRGKINYVKYLLEAGANIHNNDEFPLKWAARKGYIHIVKLLLDNGANMHVKDDIVLKWAVESNHYNVVKFLINNGADVNSGKITALWIASYNGYYNIVKLLLDNGAKIHTNKGNSDIIEVAKERNHYDVVELLKKYM